MTNSSNGAMLYFFISTTIYFMLNYYLVNKNKYELSGEDAGGKRTRNRMLFGVYVLIVIIGEFFINLNMASSLCGSNQGQTAFTTTLIPWVIIFGVFHLLLQLYPGWLKPFSNTFGYSIIQWFDAKGIFQDVLKVKSSDYAKIYQDPSMMLNELPYDLSEFKEVIKKLDMFSDKPSTLNNLYNLILIKYSISEYVWYLLIGLLVTTISYNYIINMTCANSAEDMQKRHAKYVSNEQKVVKAKTDSSSMPSGQPTNYIMTGR